MTAAQALSTMDFEFLSGILKQRSGLALTAEKGYLIETRLQPVAVSNGLANIPALVAQLRSNPNGPLAAQVVESMTTNESMFFRDTKPFDHLAKVMIPELYKAGRHRLRIWSAACSTGQEPYSIAMVIKEQLNAFPGLSAEIYATDLAEKVLERARTGLYSQFEVQRGLPITMLMKYFAQRPNNMWEVSNELKAMVRYAPANLLTSFAMHGKFDIIFCRNVLIYFDEKTKTEVFDRLAGALNAPGYLLLGGAESIIGLTNKFKATEHRGLFTAV